MAANIISQTFGYNLNLTSGNTFAAAGGVVHYTQPNGGSGAPPKLEQRTFTASEAVINGPYFTAYRDTLDFADSLFVKRFRIIPQHAAPFYAMRFVTASDYTSFLWFHDSAIGNGRDPDETTRIFCKIPFQQVGEWRDVNAFVPRPTNLDGLPDGLGNGYYLGAFLPSMEFLYSAVPADLAGLPVEIGLEVEVAHPLSRFFK